MKGVKLNFIKRERIYILMLLFIVGVNAMHPGQVEKVEKEEKKSVSTMTFEEIGVTEQKVKDYLESGTLKAKFFGYLVMLSIFMVAASLFLNIRFIFEKARIRRIWSESTRIIREDSIRIRAPLQILKDFLFTFGAFWSKDSLRTSETNKEFVTGRGDLCRVSWGISDLIRAIIIIVFAGYIIAIIEGFIHKVFDFKLGVNLRMAINTFFIDITAGGVILYFVIGKYKEKLYALGLKFSSFFKNVLSGITAYITILPVLFIVLFLSAWVLNLLGYTPPPQPVLELFMEEGRSRVLIFLTIFVSIFGPIIEELFFRGFMYSAIKKRFGMLAAAVLTASIFSALHTNIVGFLPILTLGLLLVYLYEKTGSLIASMAVHIVHNSLILGFVFFVKELMV